MFKCPHCNEKVITFGRKLWLIRHNDICFKCGNPITTSLGLTILVTIVSCIIIFSLINFFNLKVADWLLAVLLLFSALLVQTFIIPVKKVK